MSHWINIPIEEVNKAFLSDLKKRFAAGSRLELRVVDSANVVSLSEETFWQIIDQLDWNSVDILKDATSALSNLSTAEIFLFEDLMAEKLQALDTPKHALAIYGKASNISIDGFLYIRSGVVAQGRATYEKTLRDPSTITDDFDFEPLLALAANAYQKKTGKSFEYLSHISYETYSNELEWNS